MVSVVVCGLARPAEREMGAGPSRGKAAARPGDD